MGVRENLLRLGRLDLVDLLVAANSTCDTAAEMMLVDKRRIDALEAALDEQTRKVNDMTDELDARRSYAHVRHGEASKDYELRIVFTSFDIEQQRFPVAYLDQLLDRARVQFAAAIEDRTR